MINWELLTPRNIVVIVAISIIFHLLLAPVFNSMGNVGQADE
jgi:hypothetical protein